MKTNLKTRILKKLAELGVRPHVYHIKGYTVGSHQRSLRMSEAITIASKDIQDPETLSQMVGDIDRKCEVGALYTNPPNRIDTPATWMRKELAINGFDGVAICDIRDQFSRKRGWLIACGRLLTQIQRCERL